MPIERSQDCRVQMKISHVFFPIFHYTFEIQNSFFSNQRTQVWQAKIVNTSFNFEYVLLKIDVVIQALL